MYNTCPVFPLGEGKIQQGFEPLSKRICRKKTVIIEGYQGVFFETIRQELAKYFSETGLNVSWQDIRTSMVSSAKADALIEPFLGGGDPLFGNRCTLKLADFFDYCKKQLDTPKILKPQDVFPLK